LVGVAAQGEPTGRRRDVDRGEDGVGDLVRVAGPAGGLERADASAEEVESYRVKARALVTATGGSLAEVAAVDTLLLVLALSTAWSTAPPGVRSLGATSAAARHAAHRAAVIAAATAVTDALTQA
jgi:hypothetical protein